MVDLPCPVEEGYDRKNSEALSEKTKARQMAGFS
jgi:hypothetical protein